MFPIKSGIVLYILKADSAKLTVKVFQILKSLKLGNGAQPTNKLVAFAHSDPKLEEQQLEILSWFTMTICLEVSLLESAMTIQLLAKAPLNFNLPRTWPPVPLQALSLAMTHPLPLLPFHPPLLITC